MPVFKSISSLLNFTVFSFQLMPTFYIKCEIFRVYAEFTKFLLVLGHTNLLPSSSDFQTIKVRREGKIILLILFFIMDIKIIRRAITIKINVFF